MLEWKPLKLLAAGISLIGSLVFRPAFSQCTGCSFGYRARSNCRWAGLSGLPWIPKVVSTAALYSRIQEYDADGAFLAGWFVPTSGAVFRLRVNAQEDLEVATARTRIFLRFSSAGESLEQRHDARALEEFGPKNERRWTTSDGTTYEIERSFLLPSISKHKNAERETLIFRPLCLWIFMGPFPAWMLFAVGGLLFARLEGRLRLKRRVEV